MLNVRNLCVFPVDLSPSTFEGKALGDLESMLRNFPVADPGPMEMERSGFAPPAPGDSDNLVHRVGDYFLFALVIRKRVLPESVVREEVAKKVKELAEREGRAVGARERKRIKQEVLDRLMPKAFIKPQAIRGWFDRKGWIVFDTSSPKSAEAALSRLRDAMGSLSAVPFQPASPRLVFHRWLKEREAESGFALGDACVLSDPSGGSSWTGRSVDLAGVEVEEHLNAGAVVKRLGLEFNDRVEVVFGDDGIFRKFALLDVVFEGLSDSVDDETEAFDASSALVCGEARELIEATSDVFECVRPGNE